METFKSYAAYIALAVATLSMIAAVINTYYTYKSNRMTGYLKVTAVYDTEDRYNTRNLGQSPPTFIRTDPGLRLEVKNTGRFDEQIIGIGYGLHQREGELGAPDPRFIKDLQVLSPDELREAGVYPKNSDEVDMMLPRNWFRLPVNIPAGESKSMFWGLNDEEDQIIREEASYLWFDTVRETIRVSISRQKN